MDNRIAPRSVKQEIRLADYQPPAFFMPKVDLVFQVLDDKVRVKATSQFKRRIGAEDTDLTLDGGPHMKLIAVELDCAPVGEGSYEPSSDSLVVKNVPDAFSLTVTTELLPAENTRLEGLYESGGNLTTQCEAEGFRHITYFLDRPDVLAVYDVTIEADEARYPVLLSNGNLHSTGSLNDGRHFARWSDPHPKPCYLFALVAGNLSAVSDTYRTTSGRDVSLNIYVRKPDLDKCNYAMQSLKNSMKWDEDVFGLEYDLDTYNIVAVSDFNMGAMENKGLNIFNTKYVLANKQTATDSDFDHVEGVIGHEYFHNWTGNRVTCRDWFQLSLKEGLTVFRDQEFSSDMTSRAVKRIDDVRLLRMLQFPEDGSSLAHPIRPESYIEINNFYTTTVYNKGAEVIRMMNSFMGQTNFVNGVKLYLDRHDGQAATCEQFVTAMEEAGQIDLKQFRLWYSQAGTPTLKIDRQYEGNDIILTIEQSCPGTPGQSEKKPFHMPVVVGWLDEDGSELCPAVGKDILKVADGYLLNLSKQQQQFRFTNLPKNACPSLLRKFSAPVKVVDDLSEAETAHLLKHDNDTFVRWQSGQNLMAEYLLASIDPKWANSDAGNRKLSLISDAFGATIGDASLEPAFAAELITLPSEIYIGQMQDVLTPVEIHEAFISLKGQLIKTHFQLAIDRFDQLAGAADGVGQIAKGNRKLRNVLLGYISQSVSHVEEAKTSVLNLYRHASNMTEQLAALTLVSHSNWAEKDEILEAFYKQWQHDELVIDKWFAVQAQSPNSNAVSQIKALMKHPAFTIENPNRLRSLVSTFALLNQVNFQSENGSGYNLLSGVIAKVDKLNPQTAARMVAPLGRWMRLDDERKSLMKKSLFTLLALPELSNDVKELVEKSLR